jgi:hypothetical protein
VVRIAALAPLILGAALTAGSLSARARDAVFTETLIP